MAREFLVATVPDADTLLAAVYRARAGKLRIYDVYAPYPIHDMDHAMGIRRSRLPWVTLIAGATGLLVAIFFQFYVAVLDWPMNVGGKPDNSTLAFVPICFELTILFAGLATLVAFLLRARLFPGRRERLAADGVTNNSFALVFRKRDSSFSAGRVRDLLLETGAREIEEKEADL